MFSRTCLLFASERPLQYLVHARGNGNGGVVGGNGVRPIAPIAVCGTPDAILQVKPSATGGKTRIIILEFKSEKWPSKSDIGAVAAFAETARLAAAHACASTASGARPFDALGELPDSSVARCVLQVHLYALMVLAEFDRLAALRPADCVLARDVEVDMMVLFGDGRVFSFHDYNLLLPMPVVEFLLQRSLNTISAIRRCIDASPGLQEIESVAWTWQAERDIFSRYNEQFIFDTLSGITRDVVVAGVKKSLKRQHLTGVSYDGDDKLCTPVQGFITGESLRSFVWFWCEALPTLLGKENLRPWAGPIQVIAPIAKSARCRSRPTGSVHCKCCGQRQRHALLQRRAMRRERMRRGLPVWRLQLRRAWVPQYSFRSNMWLMRWT